MTDQQSDLRTLADALTAKINSFEDYLNELPSRVKCSEKELFFDREGRRWKLFWTGPGCNRRLSDCGLDVKIKACEYFPQLVKNMSVEKEKLTSRLTEANASLDSFLATLVAKPQE